MTRRPVRSTVGGRRSRRARGYAMAMFVAVLAILSAISSASFLWAGRQGVESIRATSDAQARAAADDALARFYASLTDPDPSATGAGTVLRAWTREASPAASKASTAAIADVAYIAAGGTEPTAWYQISTASASCSGTATAYGCRTACTSATGTPAGCYRLWWTRAADATTGRSQLVVTAVGRAGCVTAGASTCRFSRVVQRIDPQQFLDSLLYAQYTAVDPAQYALAPSVLAAPAAGASACADKAAAAALAAGCEIVALNGSDDLSSGPIYTADMYFSYCGSPTLGRTVTVGPAGSSAAVLARGVACSAAGTPAGSYSPAVASAGRLVTLPSATYATDVTTLAVALGSRALILCGGSKSFILPCSGTTHLRFGAAGVQVGRDAATAAAAAATDLPESGVIIVYGSADVANSASGPGVNGTASVFATGTLTVSDDITYYAAGARGACAASQPTSAADALGLNAASIVLANSPTAPSDLCVDAVLVSLSTAIYTSSWWTKTIGTVPTLYLYGSLASKYQPILGAYDSGTGTTISGYAKRLVHDARFSDRLLQPPYLLTPVAGTWRRLDAVAQSGTLDRDDV